jgi:predicted TIM-barrel fold metal-dependent hydrolase
MKTVIIDTHFHLGPCRVFGLNVTEEQVIKNLTDVGITAMILQPFPGAYPQPPNHLHSRIAELSRKYEGQIFGMVSINPHVLEPDEWKREARKWIKDYGFVGIKVHTAGHAVNLGTKDAEMMFELANELEVPVMVHTGLGIPFASPTAVAPLAEKFPDVKIVLAHAGFIFHAGEALFVASKYKNVYLETSWCMAEDIEMFIKTLGGDKVMFGTDLPLNTLIELEKARRINVSNEEREKFLYKTAEKVFKLKIKK